MRIIAGEFRGRQLLPPAGHNTRPITDRVKQSLFDIITPLLPDARIYDCFAGTGSMGLESLSRGAAHATFFEMDRSAVALLRRNIDTLRVSGRCGIVSTDLFRWFSAANSADGAAQLRADLVFLDPPYRFLRERSDDLRKLAHDMVQHHLKPQSTVVFRHDAGDTLELPGLPRYDERRYGGMVLEFLRPAGG